MKWHLPSKRHYLKDNTCFDVSIIFEMCQKSLKVKKHILNHIRILYDIWHIVIRQILSWSIRRSFYPFEGARDGVEAYAYYTLLEKLANKHDDAAAKKILENVKALVFIPNAGERKSEHLLPQPERLTYLRWLVVEAIVRLMR